MLAVAGALEIVLRLLSPSAGLVGVTLPHFLLTSPFAYWFSWSIGAYLADCHLQKKPTFLAHWRFEAVVLAALATPFFKPLHTLAFPAFAAVTAVAMDRLLSGRWALPTGLWWRHLAFLGVVSYSFYLFHQPIMGLTIGGLLRVFPGIQIPQILCYVMCLGWYLPILGLSYLAYTFLEKPSIAMGSYLTRRPTPKVVLAESAPQA